MNPEIGLVIFWYLYAFCRLYQQQLSKRMRIRRSLYERKLSSTFDTYQVLGFGHNCLTFFPLNFEPVSENSPREDCLPTLELFATEAL